YLPLYSPDLNPIEEVYSFFKAYMRWHGSMFHNTVDSKNKAAILLFMYTALGSITEKHVCGWMRHSGYI
ncbi:hypothetical protein K439DRAFT_1274110, partial [Ramaria rubella]